MASPSLALGFVTIERPHVAQRFIRAARRYFPDLPIYVADQSRRIAAMSTFYASHNVTLIRMPYDCGVTVSRNRLAREIKEDYFVLCDDDHVLGAQTRFDEAVRIFEADPEMGVIGGRLHEFYSGGEWLTNWELYLEYDPRQRILFLIPIYELAPKVREVAGIRYYLCDAVHNFSMIRRSIFSAGAQWDERFKSLGEHEDFFLNLKVNTPFRVAHLPTMQAYDHHPEGHTGYQTLRDRTGGWHLFYQKWNLEQHIQVGLGVRTIDDVATVIGAEDARARFFVNADISLRRTEPTPHNLLVENFKGIATVGALDQSGNRAGGPAAARVLLNGDSGSVVAAPDVPIGDPQESDPAMDPRRELTERYALEWSGRGRLVGATNEEIDFRYDPILASDADFFLWYRGKGLRRRDNRSADCLAVVIRWSAADGTSLLWRSRRKFLDLEPMDYWRPLLLEIPVPPRGCRWLRFDVITDGGASSHPVCTGFLFAPPAPGRPAQTVDTTAIDVVGLSRIPHDGASPERMGAYLEDVGRTCAKLAVPVHYSPFAPDMSVLRTNELTGLEVLFFAGWDGLGRSLVSARLPAAADRAPSALAVPKAGWRAPEGRVYGYGRGAGFVALSVVEGHALA